VHVVLDPVGVARFEPWRVPAETFVPPPLPLRPSRWTERRELAQRHRRVDQSDCSIGTAHRNEPAGSRDGPNFARASVFARGVSRLESVRPSEVYPAGRGRGGGGGAPPHPGPLGGEERNKKFSSPRGTPPPPGGGGPRFRV